MSARSAGTVSPSGAGAGSGPAVGAGGPGTVVAGNNLVGNTAGALNDAGADTIIRDNAGFKTEASGTATVKAIKVDERTAVEKGAVLIELE